MLKKYGGKIFPIFLTRFGNPEQAEVNELLPGQNRNEVYYNEYPASRSDLPVEAYCLVTICLDSRGDSVPNAIPLLLEMEGHAVKVGIYIDMFDRIFAYAIGGATTHATRNAVEKLE
jgi:hypothetical protein